MVHIFALLRVEAAGGLVRQQLGEADDGLQRRAQLVGDVLDEVGLQPVGGLQRLVALRKHALDAAESVTSTKVSMVMPSGSATVA